MVELLRYVNVGDQIIDFQGQWIIYEAERKSGPKQPRYSLLKGTDVNLRLEWLINNFPEKYVAGPT